MTAVQRSAVSRAVVDLLRSQLAEPVGWASRPSNIPDGTQAYHVVHNVTVGQGAYVGSAWTQKESMERVRFLIITVGSTVEQAETLNDEAAGVLVDRDNGTLEWVHDLTIPGHKDLGRHKMGTIPTSGTKPPQCGTYVEVLTTIV